MALALARSGSRRSRRARRRGKARRRRRACRGTRHGLHHAGARGAGHRDAAARLLRRPAAAQPLLGAVGFGAVDLPPFLAGVLSIGFIYGAYLTETFRGAYLAVPRGQLDAGRALGLHPFAVLWTVMLPQLVRFALPGYANVWQVLVKSTARRLGHRAAGSGRPRQRRRQDRCASPSSSSSWCSPSICSSPGSRPWRSSGWSAGGAGDRPCALTSSSPTGRSSPRASGSPWSSPRSRSRSASHRAAGRPRPRPARALGVAGARRLRLPLPRHAAPGADLPHLLRPGAVRLDPRELGLDLPAQPLVVRRHRLLAQLRRLRDRDPPRRRRDHAPGRDSRPPRPSACDRGW